MTVFAPIGAPATPVLGFTKEAAAAPVETARLVGDIDLRGLAEFFGRQARLICIVVGVVLATAVLALVIIPPAYQATALIVVDPSRKNLLDPAPPPVGQSTDSARVDTEVEILRSDDVMMRVIAMTDLASDPEFGAPSGWRRSLVAFQGAASNPPPAELQLAATRRALSDALTVRRRGFSYVIALDVRSMSADKAAIIANALAAAYIQRQVELKSEALTSARSLIQTQLGVARAVAAAQDTLPVGAATPAPDIQRTVQDAGASYLQLLARSRQLETQSALQVADSRVVSPALVPGKAVFPNVPLFLGAAAVFAIVAGAGLGFARENYRGAFTSSDQAEAMGHAVVAVLPQHRMQKGYASLADAVIRHPLSRYSESVRRLRARIDRALAGQRGRDGSAPRAAVILVTSSLSGEGKTTTALSLARTYALAGQRVLIVDCDLRSPDLHKQLGLAPSTSLVDFLSGTLPKDAFRNAIIDDKKSSLTAVLGSRKASSPTDQLLSKRAFSQLIAAAAKMFDYVILDSPPVEAATDGLYLAEHADAIVFVVEWARTPQRTAINALDIVDGMKTRGAELMLLMNRGRISHSRRSAYSSYRSG